MVRKTSGSEADIPLGKTDGRAVVDMSSPAKPVEEKPEAPAGKETAAEVAAGIQQESDAEFMKRYDDIDMDELIMHGYVSHTAEIGPGLSVKIRTLKKKEELAIKNKMAEYMGTQVYILDQTNTNTVTHCLMEINGDELPDEFDARREVVDDLSDVLAVAIIDEFRDLNKALVILLKGSSKNSLALRLLGPESI